MRPRLATAGLALLAWPAASFAQSPPPPPAPTLVAEAAQDQDLESLMAILTQETAVATRTKMNSDFVPGIVTVLQGDELEAMGVETLGEALGMVPGMQSVRDQGGRRSVIVRGIDFPFNLGNVKVTVDGVSVTRETAGINGTILQIPIQQIARIEVIRGPGSVVYGDFAFMGLVNVVTRTQKGRVFARAGGDEALSAGAQGDWKDHAGRSEVSVALSGWTSDDAPVAQPATGEEDHGFAQLQARRDGFSLGALVIPHQLDRTTAAASTHSEQVHWAVQGAYARDLHRDLHGELRGSFRDNHFDTFEELRQDFRGTVSTIAADLRWTGWRGHELLAGGSFASSTIDSANRVVPQGLTAPGGAPGIPVPVPDIHLRDYTRHETGVMLQDRFDVGGAVSITAGARFDDYSDIDARVTPRAAVVWRITDHHILKAQYAEGFRPPTFFELFADGRAPNPELDFEVNGTAEINYVARFPRTVFRATAFHTRVRDMIFPQTPILFTNDHEAQADGFELELEHALTGQRLKAVSNVSYVHERDDRHIDGSKQPSGPTADWLANVALLFRATGRLALAARWNHISQRHVTRGGDPIDAVDLSLTGHDLLVTGLQLRGGVKNVFDDPVQYVFANPLGANAVGFPGRTFWAQLAWGR